MGSHTSVEIKKEGGMNRMARKKANEKSATNNQWAGASVKASPKREKSATNNEWVSTNKMADASDNAE